jgi:hypothetical protein
MVIVIIILVGEIVIVGRCNRCNSMVGVRVGVIVWVGVRVGVIVRCRIVRVEL